VARSVRTLTPLGPTGRRVLDTPMPDAPIELVSLSETDFALAQPTDDIRGRIVVDKVRYGIGMVYDLLVDPTSRRAFLMIVRGSDILLGDKDPLIPIDAIRYGDDEYVYVNLGHESVAQGPPFDDDRIADADFQAAVYGWYGSLPYWHPEYVYPSDWSLRLADSAQRPRQRR
jgi:hypothetical protein